MSNEKPGSNAGLFDSCILILAFVTRPRRFVEGKFISRAPYSAFLVRRTCAPLFERPTLRFPPKRSC
jgi:hypothetical protein